jgi:hypothetical protein
LTSQQVEILTENGRAISFAVSAPDQGTAYDGPVPASVAGSIARKGRQTLSGGMAIAREIARALTRNLDSLEEPPDRITAEVGLAVTTEADFVVATSSAEAHLVITMEWNRSSS